MSPSGRCVRGISIAVLCHRIRTGTPAQGASITSTTIRPWPCAIQPTTRAARQLVARLNTEHQGPWGASNAHQMEALQTDEQITPITTIKRRTAAAGRVRHCRGPLKIAGVEVRSSSRTSTSTRNPRSTPGHPHSTRKSHITRLISSHRRRRSYSPEVEAVNSRSSAAQSPGVARLAIVGLGTLTTMTGTWGDSDASRAGARSQ